MRTNRVFLAVISAVILTGVSVPALACSYNKLDLDYCGDRPRAQPKQEPINRPDVRESPPWTPPDPHPTLVRPRDSRGNELYGIGIEKKF